MGTQQSDPEDEGSFGGGESPTCESRRFVLIVLISICLVLNIIAVGYYATVPSKNSLFTVLGVAISSVIFVCGVITYFRTRRSSKSSYNFQSSSDEVYDVPWNISEDEEDYGIRNPGLQSSFTRCTAEAGRRQSPKQRRWKHPLYLSELDTLEYTTDNEELFSYFHKPKLPQHEAESRNEMEYLNDSFKIRDERQQRRRERKEWSPINSLEHPYRNTNKTDWRELEENGYWSGRGRCRNRYSQEHWSEPDVYQSRSARLSKQRPRSKSETRDYKAGRNRTARQNLFLSSRRNSSNSYKRTECSVAQGMEIAEYKNIKNDRLSRLAPSKSDSKIYLSRKKRDHTDSESEETAYNQKFEKYRQQISQYNRETSVHPSNRSENADPSKGICSPTSNMYKNYPTLHRQQKVPLPLSPESERMQHVSEYGRTMNCSLAKAQKIGKYATNGIQAVQSTDENRNDSVFETEAAGYSPSSRKRIHFQSLSNARTWTLPPKFATRESRYLGRSHVPTVPFSSGETVNLQPHVSGKYSPIGNCSSSEYSPGYSEGYNYSLEQIAVKSPLQPNVEENQWVNISQMRQNSLNCRKAKESHARDRNEYRELVNQPLHLENTRYIIQNYPTRYSRNVENQNRIQQPIGEHELRRNERVVNSIGSNTEYRPYPQRYSTTPVVI